MYKMAQQYKLEPPKKVLVVDDEHVTLNIVAKVLYRYLGCDVYTASSGKEAISLIRSNEFDMLLIDLVMPGISGVELIKTIHQLKLQTPVIVITGNGTDEELAEVKRLGIHQIIYKPFKIATLLEMIAGVLLEKEQVTGYV